MKMIELNERFHFMSISILDNLMLLKDKFIFNGCRKGHSDPYPSKVMLFTRNDEVKAAMKELGFTFVQHNLPENKVISGGSSITSQA